MAENLTPEEIKVLKDFASARRREMDFARRMMWVMLASGVFTAMLAYLLPGELVGVGANPLAFPVFIVGCGFIIISLITITLHALKNRR